MNKLRVGEHDIIKLFGGNRRRHRKEARTFISSGVWGDREWRQGEHKEISGDFESRLAKSFIWTETGD